MERTSNNRNNKNNVVISIKSTNNTNEPQDNKCTNIHKKQKHYVLMLNAITKSERIMSVSDIMFYIIIVIFIDMSDNNKSRRGRGVDLSNRFSIEASCYNFCWLVLTKVKKDRDLYLNLEVGRKSQAGKRCLRLNITLRKGSRWWIYLTIFRVLL